MVPPRPTNAVSRSLICREAIASMPSNGSSRKSSRGPGSSAAASASFLRMPCEKSATRSLRASVSDMSDSSSLVRESDIAALTFAGREIGVAGPVTLAARADTPSETVRRDFPAQVTVASTEEFLRTFMEELLGFIERQRPGPQPVG